jgi:hypothetical protein
MPCPETTLLIHQLNVAIAGLKQGQSVSRLTLMAYLPLVSELTLTVNRLQKALDQPSQLNKATRTTVKDIARDLGSDSAPCGTFSSKGSRNDPVDAINDRDGVTHGSGRVGLCERY